MKKPSVKQDPMATPAQIEALRKRDPRAAIAHPDCPIELWWDLAKAYPMEAEASLLFPILTLESPERWHVMQRKHIGDWITRAIKAMSVRQGQIFAADCLEHVLPLFTEEYPTDSRPREAMRMRRLRANDHANYTKWIAARYAANACANEVSHISFQAKDPYALAATSVAFAAAYEEARPVVTECATAAGTDPSKSEGWLTECRWQWQRAQQYLRGEVTRVGARTKATVRRLEDLPFIEKEQWDDGRWVTFRQQPFPRGEKPWVPSRLMKLAKVEQVAIDKLVATQDRITEHGVKDCLHTKPSKKPDELPMIFRTADGAAFIQDGHHRLTAAWLRGDKTAPCRVVHVPQEQVGMAPSHKHISANPRATPEAIRSMAVKQPLKALQHPNCPLELWWELAARFPLEAPQTLAGQLILVEMPERWAQLEATWSPRWIINHVRRLSVSDQQRLAADMAEHVLPLFESAYPTDDAPRAVIAALRAYTNGKGKKDKLAAARELALMASYHAYNAQRGAHSYDNTCARTSQWHAARAAAEAARLDAYLPTQKDPLADLVSACLSAVEFAYLAPYFAEHGIAAPMLGVGDDARNVESVWEWHRLGQYLRGEVP